MLFERLGIAHLPTLQAIAHALARSAEQKEVPVSDAVEWTWRHAELLCRTLAAFLDFRATEVRARGAAAASRARSRHAARVNLAVVIFLPVSVQLRGSPACVHASTCESAVRTRTHTHTLRATSPRRCSTRAGNALSTRAAASLAQAWSMENGLRRACLAA